jgi:hypothetical protein
MKTVLAALIFLASLKCFADQPCPKASIDGWLSCRLERTAAAKINQKDATKQSETPALSAKSTSLVDRPVAPDLGAFAMDLASVSGLNSDNANGTPFVFTTSLYALISAQNGRALDPSFYNQNKNWRRFSFTLGREDNDDTNDGPANIFGGNILLINGKDPTNSRNYTPNCPVGSHTPICEVSKALKDSTVNFAKTRQQVNLYLFQELGPKLLGPGFIPDDPAQKTQFINNQLSDANAAGVIDSLSQDEVAHIDTILGQYVEQEAQLQKTVKNAIETIRKGPQLALNFSSKIRPHKPVDDYRLELTWDYGLVKRLDWTANISYDYRNFTAVGADIRGGRFANQFEYQFGSSVLHDPFKLAVSAEGKWQTKTSSTYVVQGKLTIPVMDGISLPLSASWANRSDLIKESYVKGNFGLSFDVAKLLGAFQPKH